MTHTHLPEAGPCTAGSGPSPDSLGGPARVLVVDDVPENVDLLQCLLEPLGHVVRGAYDGASALLAVAADPPDVVLLDLNMPGVDGFEVCRRLKANEATCHIPIIIVTGVSDRAANLGALEAGADDFVLKPFDTVLLNARIRNAVKSKRMHDQVLAYQRQLVDYSQTLEDRIRQRTHQLSRTQQATVFSLAKLAESRDTDTGEHIHRMRLYTQALAREMVASAAYADRLDAAFVERIYMSSPLHDIGKVGIPDQILLKPDKLTAEEFDIMKMHTVIGGETLAAAREESGDNAFLEMGTEIALSHHERWDGSGYPEGLEGEAIPLPARIVALADAYDAMSSKRPYKEAIPHGIVRETILRDRGRHFAPDVVDAFLRAERAFLEIRSRFHNDPGKSKLNLMIERLQTTEAAALS